MKCRLAHSIFLFLYTVFSYAQIPATDMYMISFNIDTDSMVVSQCSFLTSFNINGYNNQPYFYDETKVLFSSDKAIKGETDIYQLNILDKTITRLTNTQSLEYSPEVIPNTTNYSVVSVEEDKSQKLRRFNIDDPNLESELIFPELDNIAYYTWVNQSIIAIAQLEGESEQMNLLLIDKVENTRVKRVEDIGRCIKKDPLSDEGFYFIHKLTKEFWYLKYYDITTNKVSILVQLLGGVEDFDILQDGSIIIGNGSQLYRFIPFKDKDWKLIFDGSCYGINNIKRLSIFGNQMVLCDLK